jgi:hypothetical protein
MRKNYLFPICLIIISFINIYSNFAGDNRYTRLSTKDIVINNSLISDNTRLKSNIDLYSDNALLNYYFKNIDNIKRITIKVSNDTMQDIADETSIYFIDNATMNFDATLDELKFFGKGEFNPYIYTMIETDRFAVNAIPAVFYHELMIPVGLSVKLDGNYQIEVSDTLNCGAAMDVYLLDRLLNKTQDLLKEPLYKFSFNRTDFENRFFIKFVRRYIQLSIGKLTESDLFDIITQNKNVKITYHNPLKKEGKLEIMNLLGQNILKANLKENKDYNYTLEVGCYIVKLVSDNRVHVRKIYVE